MQQAKQLLLSYQSVDPENESLEPDVLSSPSTKAILAAAEAVGYLQIDYQLWEDEHSSLETKVTIRSHVNFKTLSPELSHT